MVQDPLAFTQGLELHGELASWRKAVPAPLRPVHRSHGANRPRTDRPTSAVANHPTAEPAASLPSMPSPPDSRPLVRSLITLSAVEDPALRPRATKGARRARNALTPTRARQAKARSHDGRCRRASEVPFRAHWSISQRVDDANGFRQPSGRWKQPHGRRDWMAKGAPAVREHLPLGVAL